MGKLVILALVFGAYLLFLAGCCSIFTSMHSKSLSDCDQFSGNTAEYNNCLYYVAMNTNDTSICDKIPPSDAFYVGCYGGIALARDNPALCSQSSEEKLCTEWMADECTCNDGNETHGATCAGLKAKGIRGACDKG